LTTLLLPAKGDKLVYLDLINNQLTDLTAFSHLVNLKVLYLDNNPLIGNLESLKGCQKLKELNIEDTKINSTWEHLVNLKEITS